MLSPSFVIILGGVDAALRGDGVRAAGRILEAEALDVVAQLAERGGGGAAGQPRAHHDDVVLALVGWVDQLQIEVVLCPRRVSMGPAGILESSSIWLYCTSTPASTAMGMEMLPMATSQAKAAATFLSMRRVARMIDAQRLEHAPDAVIEMHAEQAMAKM